MSELNDKQKEVIKREADREKETYNRETGDGDHKKIGDSFGAIARGAKQSLNNNFERLAGDFEVLLAALKAQSVG